MEIKLDVKLKVNDMYNFFMYHSYTRASGILSLFFGAAMGILLLLTYQEAPAGQNLLYLMFCIFFLIYNPVAFYFRALKQIKTSPIFQSPITYTFDASGITTMQNSESAKAEWKDVVKVVSTRRSIIIYLGKVRASILPKDCIGDKYDALVEMIKKYVDESKVKIK